MLTIVKSLIHHYRKEDSSAWETYLSKVIDEDRAQLFAAKELEAFHFLYNAVINEGCPSEDYFLSEFPEFNSLWMAASSYTLQDIPIYLNNLVRKRTRQLSIREISKISLEVQDDGITDEHFERFRSLYMAGREIDEKTSLSWDNYFDFYQQKKSKSTGLLTFINAIDEKIGGMNLGSVNVLAGWTGSFKTLFALNIAYHNKTKLGYNIVYVSLEVPKDQIFANLLSLHSTLPKFSEYSFIGHDKQRRMEMSEAEEKYLFETILPDFLATGGSLTILDETDFQTFSFAELRTKLEEVDDAVMAQTGSGIDAIIWDHANLFKYPVQASKSLSQGEIINQYLSFIRKIGIAFRKDKDGIFRSLCNIVLAQCNREGWARAVRKRGVYDLRALAEANELERSASRVLFVYTTDEMKLAKEATVQMLKNRFGQTLPDPITVFVDPEPYVFGDDAGFSVRMTDSDLSTIFNSSDFSEFGL